MVNSDTQREEITDFTKLYYSVLRLSETLSATIKKTGYSKAATMIRTQAQKFCDTQHSYSLESAFILYQGVCFTCQD